MMRIEKEEMMEKETPSPTSFSSHTNSPHFNRAEEESFTPQSKDRSSTSFNKELLNDHYFSFNGNKGVKNKLGKGNKVNKYMGTDSRISSPSSSRVDSTMLKDHGDQHIFSFQNEFSDKKNKRRDEGDLRAKNKMLMMEHSQAIQEDDDDLKTSTIREESMRSFNRNSSRFKHGISSNHKISNEDEISDDSGEDLESVIENASIQNQRQRMKYLMSQSNKQSSENKNSIDACSKLVQKTSMGSQESHLLSSKFTTSSNKENDMVSYYQKLLKNPKKQVNLKPQKQPAAKKPFNLKSQGSFYNARNMMQIKANLSKKGKNKIAAQFKFTTTSRSQDRRNMQEPGNKKIEKNENIFATTSTINRGRLSRSQKNFLNKRQNPNYMSIDNFNNLLKFNRKKTPQNPPRRGRREVNMDDSGEKLREFLQREEQKFKEEDEEDYESREMNLSSRKIKSSRQRKRKSGVAVATIDLDQVMNQQHLVKPKACKTERMRDHHIKNSLRKRQNDDFIKSYLSNSNINISKLKSRMKTKAGDGNQSGVYKKKRLWSRKRNRIESQNSDQKSRSKDKSRVNLGGSILQKSISSHGLKKIVNRKRRKHLLMNKQLDNREGGNGVVRENMASQGNLGVSGDILATRNVKSRPKKRVPRNGSKDEISGISKKKSSSTFRKKKRGNSETVDIKGYLSRYQKKTKKTRKKKVRANTMAGNNNFDDANGDEELRLDSPNPNDYKEIIPNPHPHPKMDNIKTRDFFEALNDEQFKIQQEHLNPGSLNFDKVFMDSQKESHKISTKNDEWSEEMLPQELQEWDNLGSGPTDNKENQMDYLNINKHDDFLAYKESKETNDESLGNSFKYNMNTLRENQALKFGDGFRAKQKLPSSRERKQKLDSNQPSKRSRGRKQPQEYKFYNDFNSKLKTDMFQGVKIPNNDTSNRSSLKSRTNRKRKTPQKGRSKGKNMCKLKIDISKISSKAIGAIKKYG